MQQGVDDGGAEGQGEAVEEAIGARGAGAGQEEAAWCIIAGV